MSTRNVKLRRIIGVSPVNKLGKYLKNKGIKQNHFAKKIGTTPSNLGRLIHGEGSITLRLAYAIEVATDGRVTLYDWIPSKIKHASPTFPDSFEKD